MKYGMIVAALTIGAGLAFLVLRSRFKGGSGEAELLAQSLDPKNVMIATSAQSDERAARLLPVKGSEDVSRLLVRPKPSPNSDGDFGPQETIQWVIDISPVQQGGVLKRDKILGAFKSDSLSKDHFVWVYGRSLPDKKWAYPLTADAPEDYDQLALGVDLKSVGGDTPTAVQLDQVASKIEAAAKQLGAFVTKARSSAAAAASRAKELDVLTREFEDSKAVILLAAPEGSTFEGKVIWDVMLCLGLHWGDMDEFHWENDDRSATTTSSAFPLQPPPDISFPKKSLRGGSSSGTSCSISPYPDHQTPKPSSKECWRQPPMPRSDWAESWSMAREPI